MIARCVGKSFKDNGLGGDGSSLPVGNTTQLWPTPISPSCNIILLQPGGSDAPPCVVVIYNNEYTNIFGTPGDANDGTVTLTSGSSPTWYWTNGEIGVTGDSVGAARYNIAAQSMSGLSAPWSFTTYLYFHSIVGSACGLGLRESATDKMSEFIIQQNQGLGGGGGAGGVVFLVRNWTNKTTLASTINFQNNQVPGVYLKIALSGTTLTYAYSYDNVSPFVTFLTQTLTTPFTTAPDQVGPTYSPAQAVAAGTVCRWDFIRQGTS